jgi:hypothetical protein|tara:strand:- start:471 stop:653 length:183 start_codon:yes stop_codon:yes gene_type:complete
MKILHVCRRGLGKDVASLAHLSGLAEQQVPFQVATICGQRARRQGAVTHQGVEEILQGLT